MPEHLHKTDYSMLVLFPVQEKLERSITRYEKLVEDLLKDISTRLQQVEAQLKVHI